MRYLDLTKLVRYSIYSLWALMMLGACSWLLVGAVAYFGRRGWLPPDTAGWAQAAGGILAVVVAIAVPYVQNRQLRAQLSMKDHSDRTASISAAIALMNHVKNANLEVYAEMRADKLKNDLRRIERQSAAHNAIQAAVTLREMPVTAFSTEMVHVIVQLREVASYGEYAASYLKSFNSMTYDTASVYTLLNDNIQLLSRLEVELKTLSESVNLSAVI